MNEETAFKSGKDGQAESACDSTGGSEEFHVLGSGQS